MTPDQIKEILETRLLASDEFGNPTEKSLLMELIKMAEDYNNLLSKRDD
jgi:hypothetical protein